MTQPNFMLRFSGANVQPSALSLGDLADLLESIEQLFINVAVEMESTIDPDLVKVSLVDVRAGSVGLGFASNLMPNNEISTIRIISDAITNRQYARVPSSAIRPLRAIDAYVKQSKWTATLHEGASQIPLATIRPDVDLGLPQLETVSGESVIYGVLTRVGGTPAKLRVRTLEGRPLSCFASERVAKLAGGMLYDTVGMRGQAEWDANTFTIVSFRVDEMEPYRETGIAAAMAKLREAVHGGWDDFDDVNGAVREARGSDE